MNWTDKPPTRAGAYWWKSCETARLQLHLVHDPSEYVDSGVLWCGPLVPAEEVERAYDEGWDDRCQSDGGTEKFFQEKWQDSRAKRVMEGLE